MFVLIGPFLLNIFRNKDACLHVLFYIGVSSLFALIDQASCFELSVFKRNAGRLRLRGLIEARFLRVGVRRRGVFAILIGAGPSWSCLLSAAGR